MSRRVLFFSCLWLLASMVPHGNILFGAPAPHGVSACGTTITHGDGGPSGPPVPHEVSACGTTITHGDGGPGGTPARDDDFLQRVRARILASQPFRVDFVQQVYVDEELTIQESGVIVFADRGRVKWQYLEPAPKTFILENGGYRFYDPENNQLLRGRVGARGEQLIWELLFSDRPGNASSWDARRRLIRLQLAGENGVQELEITVGADLLPARVRQAAAGEVTTLYVFSNYRSRVALQAGEFDLDLPADVEIIDDPAP